MENREYQTEAEDAVFNFLLNDTGDGILAMPGGCGKSYIMARLCKRLVDYHPEIKIIVLARDAKLLDQNCNELLTYWSDAPCGIYSAELKMRDTKSAIIFAGIQSVAKRALEFGKRHIIFIDEADQISDKEETQYQKFLTDLRTVNPNMRCIGPTATAYRLGMGCLTNMSMWSKIIIDFTKTERFNKFIEEGHLCKLVTKKTKVEVDVTNVAMTLGDFNEKELQEASDTDELNRAVVEECVKYGSDRKHWLIFASGVKHGHNLEKVFRSKGISAAMVSADKEMKRKVTCSVTGDQITYAKDCENKFRRGEIRALINVGLFQRGWNFKALDLIAWVRATQSTALWVQGCLRGTRTFPNKESCLVLDFCGNIRRLGCINDPIIPQPRRKGQEVAGEAPLKECPSCFSYVAIQAKECPDCGFIFPPPKTIQKSASTDAIMAGPKGESVIEDFRVKGIRYKLHLSKKGTESLKVCHMVGTQVFSEYKSFGTENKFILRNLSLWWEHRGGSLPIPESAEEATERAAKELTIPTVIRVDVNNKYPEIVGCDFNEDAKISDDLKPFDPNKCTCGHPPHITPCSYCESGDYEPF